MSRARVGLNHSFEKMWNGYQMRLSELKLDGELDDNAMELREYLSGMTPSEIDGIDVEVAASAVARICIWLAA